MPTPPRENSVFFGHREAVHELNLSWEKGRVHHAWLFSGPRGIGKATLAFRFSRFLLSGASEGLQDAFFLSPEHPVFRRIASGGHADLKVISSGNDVQLGNTTRRIVVDDIRSIKRVLTLTPGEGEWRIIIIDGAEEMNISAGNALLKFLEEPPPQSIFILICHSSDRLLPTVKSRCRQLNFRPLANNLIKDLIKSDIAPGLTSSETDVLVKLSEGSPGRATALVEFNGIEIYNRINDIILKLPYLDIKAVHTLANDCMRKDLGEGYFQITCELLNWSLSDIIREKAINGLDKPTNCEEFVPWQGLIASTDLEYWAKVWEKLNQIIFDSEVSKLEPKQVIIKVFTTLQQAAAS